nr:6K2 [Ashitaba mosaic virus]
SAEEVCNHLKLKGTWNKKMIVKDACLAAATFIGGVWIIGAWFWGSHQELVIHQ